MFRGLLLTEKLMFIKLYGITNHQYPIIIVSFVAAVVFKDKTYVMYRNILKWLYTVWM